jgi:tetratricopeptide (TPR) repeat protein
MRVNSGENNRTRGWICLVLSLVTLGIYWQVHGFDFVNYDDPDYITENPMVRSGLTFKGILWAFTRFHDGNWHPLTWISHMLDCQLFDLHAGGPHVVNVLFHAANAVLLFLLLHRLTHAQWRSAIVAGLFAWHPLHVESVAWVAERKDVLSTFFGLLSLIAYVRYANEREPQTIGSANSISLAASGRLEPLGERRKEFGEAKGPPRAERAGGGEPLGRGEGASNVSGKSRGELAVKNQRKAYAWALIFFAFSLLAKPMLVTLPFVMLLLDFWPLQRIKNSGWRTFLTPEFGRLASEKWPWFLLVVASSIVTFFAQKSRGAVASMENVPFNLRVSTAVISCFEYILKACWPIHLAVFYPLSHDQPIGLLLGAIAFLVVVSVTAVMTIEKWPFLLVGWLWFLGMLVPVIGLVQVGSQAMADRYTYMPLTGFFIMIVWGAWEFLQRIKWHVILIVFTGAVLFVVLAILTRSQLQYWRNTFSLFTHDLAVTRENATANNNLGAMLAEVGQPDKALAHYGEAARIEPNNAYYQNNFAVSLARAGKPDAAIDHYLAAISADPRFAKAYSNLGALFLGQHRLNEAITNFSEAVKIEPNNGGVRNNLANALSAAGRLDDALVQFSEAIRLEPTNAMVHFNAALALVKAGRANDALAQFAEAVRLNPSSAAARYELGRQLFSAGQFPAAVEQFTQAAKLKPNYVTAEFYEAAALGELNRYDEAIIAANRALQSANDAGQTNLVPRINKALEAFKSHRPFRAQNENNN